METQETQDLLLDIEQETMIVHATVGQRFLNYIIDMVGMYALATVIILAVYWITGAMIVDDSSPGLLVGCIAIFVYYSLLEGITNGRSLGKLVTRTRVIKEDGSTPTISDAMKRSVSRLAPFEVLSAFSGHPWHDKWTRTYVVKTR
ncbi:RDD family protein [Chitinophagaceae bacterium 26-R-25]|nr:RDD family protein [Chitinophagaceae bacterium 26-R-25]